MGEYAPYTIIINCARCPEVLTWRPATWQAVIDEKTGWYLSRTRSEAICQRCEQKEGARL